MWYNLNACYMAHGVQYMPLPAPCIKLWSGNQSHNQFLIMLLTLVTCRRRASASSFQALVYRESLPAKNISAGLVVALLQEKTELGDASEVHARCGFLLEMGWGNTALWQDLWEQFPEVQRSLHLLCSPSSAGACCCGAANAGWPHQHSSSTGLGYLAVFPYQESFPQLFSCSSSVSWDSPLTCSSNLPGLWGLEVEVAKLEFPSLYFPPPLSAQEPRDLAMRKKPPTSTASMCAFFLGKQAWAKTS